MLCSDKLEAFLVKLVRADVSAFLMVHGKRMEKNAGNNPDTCKPDVFRAIDEDMEASQ